MWVNPPIIIDLDLQGGLVRVLATDTDNHVPRENSEEDYILKKINKREEKNGKENEAEII